MSDIEIGQRWKTQVEKASDRIKSVGRLDVGVEEGVYHVAFEGQGVVDVTGQDGGGELTNLSDFGYFGLEDMVPEEAQLRRDPETGAFIRPQYEAKIVLTADIHLIPIKKTT